MFSAASSASGSAQLVEIGGLFLVLGITAYLATMFRISPVPFFLLIGLAFGKGGLLPFELSQQFLNTGAQIGALLLLLLLGLEYSIPEISRAARHSRGSALIDLANFLPGIVIALFLDWGAIGALALGGITYVSSSGIATQLLRENGQKRTEVAKRTISVLIFEDLLLAPYLPLVVAIASGLSVVGGFISVSIACTVTGLVLLLGSHRHKSISKVLNNREPNALLLTVFGTALLAGGLANLAGFSGAVAAFLVGLVFTGDVASTVRKRLSPLRDLFAALFFLFFGLSTDPADLIPMLPLILILTLPSTALKFLTGWSVGKGSENSKDWLRISGYLVPRGEFSVLIAGLVINQEFGPKLQTLTVGYVIVTAFVGSLILRFLRED